jgi:hypothetical protein
MARILLSSRMFRKKFERRKRIGSMKLHNIVRTQLMLMGLGAALLFAGSAYAQQDMDPTDFPINSGTPNVETAAVQPKAQTASTTTPANTATAVSFWTESEQESELTRVVMNAAMATIMFVGMASITFYAVAARRERRLQKVGLYRPW